MDPVSQPSVSPTPSVTPKGGSFFKVLSLVLGIIIIVILAVVGTVYYLSNKQSKPQVQAPKTQPTSAQPKVTTEPSIAADPTANWKPYSNAKWKVSLRYPPSWSSNFCDNDTSVLLFLGPTKDTTGICASEFGGKMSLFIQGGDKTADHILKAPDFTDIVTQSVIVDGVSGQRISGTGTVEGQPLGNNKGNKQVTYVFFANANTYNFGYVQTPSGALATDNLSDFDLMIKNTLKFSP